MRIFSIAVAMSVMAFACSSKLPTAPKVAVTATAPVAPVIKGLPTNPLIKLAVYLPESEPVRDLASIYLDLDENAFRDLDSIQVFYNLQEPNFKTGTPSVTVAASSRKMQVPVSVSVRPGYNYIWIAAKLKPSASLDGVLEAHVAKLTDAKGNAFAAKEEGTGFVKRKAIAIRKAWDNNVNTYRIPGMVQTEKGTLVAVYDIRYTTSVDLPGNIDVGMSRSTDGGQTWEPMKIIMDMGAPQENNGVGDPAIVYDPNTRKLFVAALWSKGNRSIAGSGPGLTPDETGQFVISESGDDGLTWTAPLSITPQVKNPIWRLFFQGPGNGMVMKDSKIVFAAQYWDENKMPHSTIIYSADGGRNWSSGIGAKSNTTEAQVIETSPGKLMLSMRDNRGSFRSIATTTDMGKTWVEHPTSYKALVDPVCMAGFTRESVIWKGMKKDIVFFSNPATSSGRYNITIKASEDLAESWTASLLVDERSCFGYSVMCKVDDNNIGLLYEGSRDLYFIKIPVKDISK